MKITFRQPKLNKSSFKKLEIINSIIEEYQSDGYVLTLRQLYYQLVSRDIIPNKQAEYAKISNILKEGRMGGIVDWNAIEDRLRQPDKPSSFDGPEDILNAAINQYALPRMEGQPIYLEVWVEKDALSGVLKRVTKKYHIPIMVNRGYSSVSAMYDAYNRFVKNGSDIPIPIKVLYLGDHDPSGLDMVRDIKNRIHEFVDGSPGEIYDNFDFTIEHIALTTEQVEQYNPPPNPAKFSDPRAGNYISLHGTTSWEVDALRPDVLNRLLTEAILDNIDEDQYLDIVAREESDKQQLKDLKKYLH